MFEYEKKNNSVSSGNNVELSGSIVGNGNRVTIGDSKLKQSKINLLIQGDNNSVDLSDISYMNVTIRIGSHVRANKVRLKIGEDCSSESNFNVFLYNSGNICEIGDNCMISNSVTIRCGESPHLIFDKETKAYLDTSEGVFIGNHVWLGEGSYITKNVTISDDCIVGAMSVVTKRFDQQSVAIAGNPAKVVRENVEWFRNYGKLVKDSDQYNSYYEAVNKYK